METEKYAKGGKVGSQKKTSYENHMAGEKKHASCDYESHMMGQKAKKEKVQKFAMGGVAKIRHKQSMPNGLPVRKAAKKA